MLLAALAVPAPVHASTGPPKPPPKSSTQATTTAGAIPAPGGTWTWQHPKPDALPIVAVSCPTTTVCYAPSVNSTVLKSTDGGVTWTTSGIGAAMFGISCADANHCVAAGFKSAVAWTSSGGPPWNSITIAAAAGADLNGVSCPTTAVCYSVDGAGAVFKSQDGGATWSATASTGRTTALTAIACTDALHCFVANPSAAVLLTADGGATWTSDPSHGGALNGIACSLVSGAPQCVGVGSGGLTETFPSGGPGTVLSTKANLDGVSCPAPSQCLAAGEDGNVYILEGATWVHVSAPTFGSLRAISCPSTQQCVVSGDDGVLALTTVGGTTWRAAHAQDNSSFNHVACPSATVCYATAGSSLAKSSDSGATWTLDTAAASALVIYDSLGAISCTSASECWVFGGVNSHVYHTTDGGATWTVLDPNIRPAGYSNSSCPAAGVCYVVGQSSGGLDVVTTSDSGAHWANVAPASIPSLNQDISCPTTTTCFVEALQGGGVGTFLVTTDSGAHWTTQAETKLESISCPSTTTCFASGQAKVAATTDGGVTWTDQTPAGTTAEFQDVNCATTTACVAVSYPGNVLNTTDGRTWQPQSSGAASLADVFCTSASACIAVGPNGTLLTTSNGGAAWTHATPIPTPYDFSRVSCPTTTSCYAAEKTHGGVYHSTDGQTWAWDNFLGQTSALACATATTCVAEQNSNGATELDWTNNSGANWIPRPAPDFATAFSCPDATHCLAVDQDGGAFSSTDGGDNWGTRSVITNVAMSGVSCGSVTVCYATSTVAPGKIYVTTDFGATWSQSFDLSTDLQGGFTTAFNAISCPTATACFAVGQGGLIASTSDGVAWRTIFSEATANLTSISCPSATTCFASSDDSGTLLRSTDSGGVWQFQFGGSVAPLRSISCPSTTFCAAVGDGGAIGVTTNGGTAWSQSQPSGTIALLLAVSCPASNVCYAAGNPDAEFLKTNDGGSTWTEQPVAGIDKMLSLSCPDANTCYAVGWPGAIYKTGDGGTTWNRMANPLGGQDQSLTSISCYSNTHCVAVGLDGVALSTADGTNWRIETTGTTLGISSISCPSSSTCVAVGSPGMSLVRTNGSWQTYSTGSTHVLESVACPSVTTCYGVGTSGTILVSTSSGVSWSPETSGTTNLLLGIACLRTTVCMAVGDFGTGLATVDGSTWINEQLPTTNPLFGVAFWDTRHVYVAGFGGAILANSDFIDLCDAATLQTVVPQSQQVGTAIAFTASANGCSNPEFKFFVQPPGGSWAPVTSPCPTGLCVTGYQGASWTWNTNGLQPGVWGVGVWAREQGSAAAYEAYYIGTFVLSASTCTSAGLTASAAGSQVTLTASSTNCPAPSYRFWMLPPGGSWTVLQDWTIQSTFAWNTTGRAAGTYQLGVWARNYGSPNTYDAYGIITYQVGTGCTSAPLAPDTAQPAQDGVTVVFTAGSSGCTNPQYQYWLLEPGVGWIDKQPYSAATNWSWDTFGWLPGTYEVGVWVKQSSSSAAYDAYYIETFTVGPNACTGPNLNSDTSPPAPVGSLVAFHASSYFCSSPQFEFWVLAPNSSTWQLVQGYLSGSTFYWNTTGLAPGPYRIGFWTRESGSLNPYDSYDITTFWLGT